MGPPADGRRAGAVSTQSAASWEGSLKRVVTGAILIPVIVYIVLYAPAAWILALSSVTTLLGLLEFNKLCAPGIRDSRSEYIGLAAGVLVPPLFFLYGTEAFFPIVVTSIFALFLNGVTRKRDLKDSAADIAFKTLGVSYVALPLAYPALIKRLDGGQWWLLFLFVTIWANDTFAYFTGRAIGRHKLSPEISPKKTVEGAAGGIIGGFMAAALYDHFLSMGIGPLKVFILSFIFGVVGIIGDLAESLLKRGAGVKDSGTLIPGHGGILDRIDSLLFPMPVLYYFLIWFQAVAG